jgi:hypothetical protein
MPSHVPDSLLQPEFIAWIPLLFLTVALIHRCLTPWCVGASLVAAHLQKLLLQIYVPTELYLENITSGKENSKFV